LSENS